MRPISTFLARVLITTLSSIPCGAMQATAATPACKTPDAVNAEAKPIDSSIITANDTSWDKTFSAGQSAYVTLTQGAPPHVTAVTVRFYDKTPNGDKDACSSTVVVTPLKPVVVSHSVFGSAITYNLDVSLAQDVDVALVKIELKALPKP